MNHWGRPDETMVEFQTRMMREREKMFGIVMRPLPARRQRISPKAIETNGLGHKSDYHLNR